MRKEEFERRAAEMRARLSGEPTQSGPIEQPIKQLKQPMKQPTVLCAPDLPAAPPYAMLRNVWKRRIRNHYLLQSAMSTPSRAARALATQQVGFDGLVCLRGDGILDIAASTRSLPEALRSFDRLIRAVADRGGKLTVTDDTTILLQSEVFKVRLRETSERRSKRGASSSFPEYEYFPTGTLLLRATHDHGSEIKALAADAERFLDRLERLAARLPRLRQQQRERERAREEEWARSGQSGNAKKTSVGSGENNTSDSTK